MITGKIDPEVAQLAFLLLEYDDIEHAEFACNLNGYVCDVGAGWMDAYLDWRRLSTQSVAVSLHSKCLIVRIGSSFHRLDRETAKATIEAHL